MVVSVWKNVNGSILRNIDNLKYTVHKLMDTKQNKLETRHAHKVMCGNQLIIAAVPHFACARTLVELRYSKGNQSVGERNMLRANAGIRLRQ